jgi:hypothetical protein
MDVKGPQLAINMLLLPECDDPYLDPEPWANGWGVPGKWRFGCGLVITTDFAAGRAVGEFGEMIRANHELHHSEEHSLKAGCDEWGQAIKWAKGAEHIERVKCGVECASNPKPLPSTDDELPTGFEGLRSLLGRLE